MFKTSAARRATVRRSKRRHPPTQNTRQKTDWSRKNRHRINEQRRAKRHRQARQLRIHRRALDERYAGMRIATQGELARDTTRWRGPGWIAEAKLETVATEILHGTPAAAAHLQAIIGNPPMYAAAAGAGKKKKGQQKPGQETHGDHLPA